MRLHILFETYTLCRSGPCGHCFEMTAAGRKQLPNPFRFGHLSPPLLLYVSMSSASIVPPAWQPAACLAGAPDASSHGLETCRLTPDLHTIDELRSDCRWHNAALFAVKPALDSVGAAAGGTCAPGSRLITRRVPRLLPPARRPGPCAGCPESPPPAPRGPPAAAWSIRGAWPPTAAGPRPRGCRTPAKESGKSIARCEINSASGPPVGAGSIRGAWPALREMYNDCTRSPCTVRYQTVGW